MGVVISKNIPHKHNGNNVKEGRCWWGNWDEAVCSNRGFEHGHYGYLGYPGNCPVCGAPFYRQTYYALQCKAEKCGTLTINDNNGTLTATVTSSGNDAGVSNVSIKWYFNGKMVAEGNSYTPTDDGDYTVKLYGWDGKGGYNVSVETTFYFLATRQWESVRVGDIEIYGMAVGDTLCNAIAIGDTVIERM